MRLLQLPSTSFMAFEIKQMSVKFRFSKHAKNFKLGLVWIPMVNTVWTFVSKSNASTQKSNKITATNSPLITFVSVTWYFRSFLLLLSIRSHPTSSRANLSLFSSKFTVLTHKSRQRVQRLALFNLPLKFTINLPLACDCFLIASFWFMSFKFLRFSM